MCERNDNKFIFKKFLTVYEEGNHCGLSRYHPSPAVRTAY